MCIKSYQHQMIYAIYKFLNCYYALNKKNELITPLQFVFMCVDARVCICDGKRKSESEKVWEIMSGQKEDNI